MKKYICLLLAVLVWFCVGYSPAKAEGPEVEKVEAPSDQFIQACQNFFSEQPSYRALDADGNDVSAAFRQRYISLYQQGNYIALQGAFLAELSAFTWREESTSLAPDAVMTLRAEDFFYVLGTTKDHMPGKTFEMLYSIYGTYAVADGYDEIMSHSNAYLNIESFDAGALFSYNPHSIYTNAQLSSDHNSVTFTASFKVDLTYLPYSGVPLWSETFGPYSNSVIGYAP